MIEYGNVKPASNAVEAHIALNRQRSAAAPSGMRAASPAHSMLKTATSEAEEPSSSNLRKKNGAAPIQSHCFPPAFRTWLGAPANPWKPKPHTKYMITATEKMHSEAIMVCAAARERPKPEFTSAIPQAASGMRSRHTMQITVARPFVTRLHPPESSETAPPMTSRQPPPPDRRAQKLPSISLT